MRDDSAHSRPYRMRHATMLLALMVFCVLTLGLTACDGEATYTPPPPTTIGRGRGRRAQRLWPECRAVGDESCARAASPEL